MVGDEKIYARLQRLEQALARLQRIHAQGWEAYRADLDLHDIADRNMQVALECCIDIANHIIAARGLRMPQSSADAFAVLAEASLLPAHLAQRLAQASGFRNIIVREYLHIDRQRAFAALGQLSDLSAFAAHVLDLLAKSDS